jgi:hypothetical protein
LTVVFAAPDSLLATAAGIQDFGLNLKPFRQQAPILNPNTIWRIPTEFVPEKLFLPSRRLTDEQIAFLMERRARKKR